MTLQKQNGQYLTCLIGNVLFCYQLYSFVIIAKESCGFVKANDYNLFSYHSVITSIFTYFTLDGCTKQSSECPGEGFVGKDCTCWCPGNPVRPCTSVSRAAVGLGARKQGNGRQTGQGQGTGRPATGRPTDGIQDSRDQASTETERQTSDNNKNGDDHRQGHTDINANPDNITDAHRNTDLEDQDQTTESTDSVTESTNVNNPTTEVSKNNKNSDETTEAPIDNENKNDRKTTEGAQNEDNNDDDDGSVSSEIDSGPLPKNCIRNHIGESKFFRT